MKARLYAKRIRVIKKGISGILGLEYDLIEILPPNSIPNGLQIRVHLYVENEESKKRNHEDLIENARATGKLADIITHSWHLKKVPIISNVECKLIQSKNEIKRLLSVSMNVEGGGDDTTTTDTEMAKPSSN